MKKCDRLAMDTVLVAFIVCDTTQHKMHSDLSHAQEQTGKAVDLGTVNWQEVDCLHHRKVTQQFSMKFDITVFDNLGVKDSA